MRATGMGVGVLSLELVASLGECSSQNESGGSSGHGLSRLGQSRVKLLTQRLAAGFLK